MNDITHAKASDLDPAELAKLNEENALKGVDEDIDAQPVVEHKTTKRRTTKEEK